MPEKFMFQINGELLSYRFSIENILYTDHNCREIRLKMTDPEFLTESLETCIFIIKQYTAIKKITGRIALNQWRIGMMHENIRRETDCNGISRFNFILK